MESIFKFCVLIFLIDYSSGVDLKIKNLSLNCYECGTLEYRLHEDICTRVSVKTPTRNKWLGNGCIKAVIKMVWKPTDTEAQLYKALNNHSGGLGFQFVPANNSEIVWRQIQDKENASDTRACKLYLQNEEFLQRVDNGTFKCLTCEKHLCNDAKYFKIPFFINLICFLLGIILSNIF